MVDIAGQSIFMLIGNQPQFLTFIAGFAVEQIMGIFSLNRRGWSTLLILRKKTDLAMVRNEAGKPFIYKP